jgi:2-oxoglutarate ferredoxin oxidoreductase subunit beta
MLTDAPLHYCPGCTHGIIHKLVAQAITELGVEGKTVGVAPVGCAVLAYNYFSCDMVQAPHGRAPAVATGLKRALPDGVIFTYQGDGDLAAIGTAETVHAASRGENIVIIFVNNAIYGMTGGQMAPTTLMGMKTATSPHGREASIHGYPYKIADMVAMLDGVCYVTRQSVHTPAAARKAKKAIRQAFENSMAGRGLSFVEMVSSCNSGWKQTPVAANKWMEENMFPFYKLGDIKVVKEA